MAKSYLQLQQELHFDELMRWLDSAFQRILDQRAKNISYALAEVLSVLVFDSMAALFRHLASLYRLQLE